MSAGTPVPALTSAALIVHGCTQQVSSGRRTACLCSHLSSCSAPRQARGAVVRGCGAGFQGPTGHAGLQDLHQHALVSCKPLTDTAQDHSHLGPAQPAVVQCCRALFAKHPSWKPGTATTSGTHPMLCALPSRASAHHTQAWAGPDCARASVQQLPMQLCLEGANQECC